MTDSSAPWWQTGVFYQIYPRSFADSTDTGVGDLEGIARRLDYLAWLGVDGIWLSPFFTSPMADYGYDVADYCDVDPLFGDLAIFDRLVTEAHRRGLKVLIDWVLCHTSDQHPWFVEARAQRDSDKRDWYYFRDPAPDGGPPNNWTAQLRRGIPAWTLDEGTGQYYLHSFLPEQPDLNWEHPPVKAAMLDTLRFWLDRGVDGFRLDALHNLGKDPALPSVPPERASTPHESQNDDPRTHVHLEDIRKVTDSYEGDRVLVGEVWLKGDFERILAYYGGDDRDELHLSFYFPMVEAPWDADALRAVAEEAERVLVPHGAWPTFVLSNHDVPRHRTRYGGSEARARAAAFLLLGLRGTPFLYQGDELGLSDAVVPPARVRDPGGRDGCRAPIPWDREPPHGWPEDPWLPFPPEAAERSVEAQRADPGSVLALYRRLLEARRASAGLTTGRTRFLDAPTGVLAWERSAGDDRRVVLISFRAEPAKLPPGEGLLVEVASDGDGEGEAFDGLLAPDRAVLLRPG